MGSFFNVYGLISMVDFCVTDQARLIWYPLSNETGQTRLLLFFECIRLGFCSVRIFFLRFEIFLIYTSISYTKNLILIFFLL
ncbi:hypothetical protein HanRHA438_Chr03g0126471 [Helianthus annuus]|nr:hypothetical protein HanRHA438_Chr03g0126471 [Helianthus annuus]